METVGNVSWKKCMRANAGEMENRPSRSVTIKQSFKLRHRILVTVWHKAVKPFFVVVDLEEVYENE